MKNRLYRFSSEILALAFILVLVDTLPIPFVWVGIVALLIWASLFFFPTMEKILVLFSVGLGFLVVNALAPRFMQATYYREHELLVKDYGPGFKRYGPNQDIKIEKSHGDLIALGLRHPQINSIREDREILFRSDEWGYRSYSGGRDLVLVGDSFVVGNGNTQKDNLSAMLLEEGLEAYNLGHNGDIAEYLRSLAFARREIGLGSPAILFAFEGNDFSNVNYCVQEKSSLGIIRSIHRRLKETHVARFLAALSGRMLSDLSDSGKAEAVEIVAKKGLDPIGFLNEYRRIAETKEFDSTCLAQVIRNASEKPRAIVFIPDKSRVYSFLLRDVPPELSGQSIFSKKLSEIAEQNSIEYVDLTDALRSRAEELVQENRFLFWRDDTHWNREGIAVAAKIVKNKVDAWRNLGLEKQ